MEAKNLRVGNLLSFSGEPVAINAGFIHDCDYWNKNPERQDAVSFENVEPIPINEEWLIKFGFDLVVKEGNQGEFRVYQLNEITYNTNHGWWWKHQLTVQPKYVHELQNLFFAITGTELELKKDV